MPYNLTTVIYKARNAEIDFGKLIIWDSLDESAKIIEIAHSAQHNWLKIVRYIDSGSQEKRHTNCTTIVGSSYRILLRAIFGSSLFQESSSSIVNGFVLHWHRSHIPWS